MGNKFSLLPLRPHGRFGPMDTAKFYRNMYSKTSYEGGIDNARIADHKRVVAHWLKQAGVSAKANVLEIGAGHGDLHAVHPRWRGLEYSAVAVKQGLKKYGQKTALAEGDATKLKQADNSIDFIFTFATLEHVPNIEKALREIGRVLKKRGVAVLAPAWNCRPWTVEKLQQRPYAELCLRQQIGKALIPLRENLLYRLLLALPGRVWREVKMACGQKVALDFTPLYPQWNLFEKYPHIADDDAFVCFDAHAAMAYYRSRGFSIISHPTPLKRLTCRGEPVVIRKV